MFADDTCLYVTAEDPTTSAMSLNENLYNGQIWANQWLVNFNPNKTKSMLFSNKTILHPPLNFQGKPIEEVNQHTHLGIIFNSSMNWKNHVSGILQSVSKLLDVMHKLSKCIDRKSLETIYESYVRPKLEYASIVWDDCSEQDLLPTESC